MGQQRVTTCLQYQHPRQNLVSADLPVNGEQKEDRVQHLEVVHLDFVQPGVSGCQRTCSCRQGRFGSARQARLLLLPIQVDRLSHQRVGCWSKVLHTANWESFCDQRVRKNFQLNHCRAKRSKSNSPSRPLERAAFVAIIISRSLSMRASTASSFRSPALVGGRGRAMPFGPFPRSPALLPGLKRQSQSCRTSRNKTM